MRRSLLAAGLAASFVACVGKPQPAVMQKLDARSSDPEEREEHDASTRARPTDESRKNLSTTERRLEKAAATAAAVAGWLVAPATTLIGVEQKFDENRLFETPIVPGGPNSPGGPSSDGTLKTFAICPVAAPDRDQQGVRDMPRAVGGRVDSSIERPTTP